MKPIAKKLSSVVLSLAMVASLTPFPGGLILADETEAETPTTVEETEAEKKKEPEKPAETKAKETKPEAEAPKETEKPAETEAPKETESAETEAPKETEKPAETPDETVPETEAPAETEKPEADQPKETEAPAETEKPAETPDETKAPDNTNETVPEETDKKDAKDVPIEEITIKNVSFVDGVLKWDAVEDATQYDINIDGEQVITVNTNSFELAKEIDRLISINALYKHNYYDISITAYDKSGIYKADWNDEIYYKSTSTFTMGTLEVNPVNNGTLSWKAYPNANYYSVYVGYGEYTTKKLSINLNTTIDELIEAGETDKEPNDKYAITVVARNTNWDKIAEYEFEYEYKSQAVDPGYGYIANPKITNGVLTWDAYQGATSYYVSISSAWGKLTDKPSIEVGKVIDELIANRALKKTGKYPVEIYAYDKNDREIAWCYEKLVYESTATAITKGTIKGASVDSKGILKWEKYEGATNYWLTIEGGWGEEWVESKTNSIDLHKTIDKFIKSDSDFKTNDGNYKINIMADNTYGATIAECTLTHHYDSTVETVIWTDIENVIFDTDGTMSWSALKNAVKYRVYVSDVITLTTSTTFAVRNKINSLIASGIIEKDNPYSITIYALDSDGTEIGGWYGSYYYKSNTVAPVVGEIDNIKATNGILSWTKSTGATKYQVTLPYDDAEIGYFTSNSIYINDAITNMIKSGKLSDSRYFYVEIYAFSKNGTLVARGDYYYKRIESNTIAVSSKTTKKAVKAKRRKKTKISAAKLYKFIDKGQGKLTFSKVSGKKQFSVDKNTGKITVKKGLKKKTYTVKVKVAAAGQTVYAATTRTVTLKIKVK
ncbi:MAG: hypothetical protein IKW88_04520 [Clostridiales bacterium]|nr:hypothetical protein [Clostridiales bacterium]